MNNINICLEDPENFLVILHDQCFESHFLVIRENNSVVVVKGFGSTVLSALEDLDRGLSGYNAQTIKQHKAWS